MTETSAKTEKEMAGETSVNAGSRESSPSAFITSDEELTTLARRAVEAFVREHHVIEPAYVDSPSLLSRPAACFVSIKTDRGELRGCIGTIEPATRTLAEELIANAISAATHDPRFLPIAPNELDSLRYSVDVLTQPEPCRFEDLDPSIYGVIVEDEASGRRGLLLPALEGVRTSAQQAEIAARKAGLTADAPLKFYRFRVQRFREPPPKNSF